MNSKASLRGYPTIFSLARAWHGLAALIVTTLLMACGGGGDSSPPSASTPAVGSPPPIVMPPPEVSTPPAVIFTLGGSISGLGQASGLTLVNGTETLAIAAGANTFTFATQLAPSAAYSVTVGTQPSGLSCSVTDGSGTLAANVNSVMVSCVQPPVALANARVITLAGDGAHPIIDGPGASVRFRSPEGVAVDSAGNVYVADTHNHAIRKITPAGSVSTLAGSITAGYADGAGAAARFSLPSGIAVDSMGNVYVADTGNQAIRKISPSGVVTTLKLLGGYHKPYGIAINSAGTIYVSTRDAVMKISTSGEISNMAYFSGGPMRDIFSSQYLAVDDAGNAYVADSGLVLKVSSSSGNVTPLVLGGLTDSGIVQTTLAGAYDSTGFVDGDGAAARFSSIRGLGVDSAGNVYVVDANTIRKITQAGTVTTLAGAGPAVAKGFADGVGAAARFNSPVGVAVDSAGNINVADTGNNAIRKISPSGVVTTSAGSGNNGDNFNYAYDVAVDLAGNLYVADSGNNMIRKVSPNGDASTLAGQGPSGLVDGPGTAARFNHPSGVAVDSAGNVYVADQSNYAIRKISPTGVVTTLAGGKFGHADGIGSAAGFARPDDVAVDRAGYVYVSDAGAHKIRKISPIGVVTTLAGNPDGGFADGAGTDARFNWPGSVAVDDSGYVYVVDTLNNAVRKISPSGGTTTLAIKISCFAGIAIDSAGNVYCSTPYEPAILKISPTGRVVTTLAGNGTSGFVDGPGAAARFNYPTGVAVDSAGNVYVADTWNNAIRKIVP